MAEPRTLVCVLAETRAHEITWPSFKSNVLETLNADLALCIGAPDGYDYSNPFWQNAKYRWTSPEYADFADAFDHAASEKKAAPDADWRMMLDVKHQWLGGIHGPKAHPGSGAILIYFRWLLWSNLEKDGVLEKYDRFIVTRSDFMWMAPHPPLTVLGADHVWIPDGEKYGGVTDRHVVLSRDTVRCYLDIIDPIVTQPVQLREEMLAERPDWNLENYIHFRLIKGGLGEKIRFFPYIMHSVRAKGGSTSWAAGVWSPVLGYYVKYPKEYWSSASFANLIRTREDWLVARTVADRLVIPVELLSRSGSTPGGLKEISRRARLSLAGLGLHIGHVKERLRGAIYRRLLK